MLVVRNLEGSDSGGRPTGPVRVSLALGHAALLGTAGLGPVSLGATLLGCATAFLGPRFRVPRGLGLPLALLPALAVLAIPSELGPQNGFVGVGAFRLAVFASLLASLLAMIRWGESMQWVLPAASVVLMMTCGMTPRELPYGALVAAQVVALALAFRPAGLNVVVLVPTLALALGLALSLAFSEAHFNDLMSLVSPPMPGQARFQAHSRLESLLDMPPTGRVLARITSQQPPGRVVGAVYVRYDQHDVWYRMPGRRNIKGIGQVWRILPGPAPLVDEVALATTQPSTLLAPRGTTVVEATLEHLETGHNGTLFLQPGSGFDGRYRIWRRTRTDLDPSPLPPERRPLYVQLPPNLAPLLRREAMRVAPGETRPEAVAAAMEGWFHQNFRYGKGYRYGEGSRSPLEEFLVDRPPAHCEFFATSMALMLRARGIPTRYVKGFLVYQKNPVGGYYTVKDHHAHAWVEAYLDGVGWKTFDPTPPGAALHPEEGFLARVRQWADALGFWWETSLADLWAWDWTPLVQSLERLPRQSWPLALLAGLWLAWRRRGPARRGRSREAADPSRLQTLLRQLDRALAARGLVRPECLTLLEWRDRVAAAQPGAARFLDTYCAARYGRLLDIDEAEAILRRLLAALRRPGLSGLARRAGGAQRSAVLGRAPLEGAPGRQDLLPPRQVEQ